MKRALLALMLCFAAGCHRHSLYVQSDYITYEDLASYQVEAPDPSKECPNTGQRLFVRWSLLSNCYVPDDTLLFLDLRFCNGCEKTKVIPITTASGYYLYKLYNEAFFNTGGIVAYQAHIVAAGRVVECWHHQVWKERIDFSGGSSTEGSPPAGDIGSCCQDSDAPCKGGDGV